VSTVIIPRIVTGQFCDHTKVREKTRSHEQNQQGIIFPVLFNSRSPRTLKGCIENALYSSAALNENCVLCEAEQMPGHRFFKFRTLPEVLIVLVSRYEVPAGGKQSEAVLSHAHCEVPDVLDLSELLEDEDGSWDQIAVYQYAAAVFHSGPTMDSGHYVAHVRNKDGNYFLLDDHGRPRVQRSSMKAINKAQNLDLTLVAYVKRRKKGKSEKADPVAEERVLKWWREHDSPPAATSTRNSPWPEHQPADLERPIRKPRSPIPGHPKPKPSKRLKRDNKKQYLSAPDSPQQDPLGQDPPGQGASKQEFTKSDYVKMDEWQYKINYGS
jgi:hypothetical protein